MTNRKFQLGYTVVEIAVVLAAALMMASWLAVNFFEWQRNLDNQAAARDIKIIKESIINYAADHSAGASELSNITTENVTIHHRLPSGRPYLPCPDTDGDGVEDRTGTYAPGGVIPLINNGTTPGEGFLDTRGSGCMAEKGFVPWRTLGTAPFDPWGNRYTYRVDPTFADEALGFDQETESSDRRSANALYVPDVSDVTVEIREFLTLAHPGFTNVTIYDIIDPDTGATRIPPQFTPTALRDRLGISFPLRVRNLGIRTTVTVRVGPIIVGDEVFQNPVAVNAAAGRPGIICSVSPCSSAAAPAVIVVGEVAAADDTTVIQGGYDLEVPIQIVYNRGNITNGLPVVVLSHGSNGYGAVPFDSGAPFVPDNCHDIPLQNLDEIQNALGPCQPAPLPTDLLGIAQPYGFVARLPVFQGTRTRNTEITQEFDDVVGWLSANEIIEALRRRGTLPVGLLPPVGLEDF